MHHNLGYSYFTNEQWQQSIESFKTALRLSPGAAGTHFLISIAYVAMNDLSGASTQIQLEVVDPLRAIGTAVIHFELNEVEESDRTAEQVARDFPEWAYNIAQLHAARGENDKAFYFLDKAIELDDPGLAEAPHFPMLNTLHGDARWTGFLKKIGHSPELLATIEFSLSP